jgi:predicted enzyme related to lactoylglutathione lyase
MPAADADESAAFYRDVFRWNIRQRGSAVSFDDGVGEVSGSWIEGAPPIDAGYLHIMVDDAVAACDLVSRHGGTVTQAPDPSAQEIVARFRDPAGNTFAMYQERSLGRR